MHTFTMYHHYGQVLLGPQHDEEVSLDLLLHLRLISTTHSLCEGD